MLTCLGVVYHTDVQERQMVPVLSLSRLIFLLPEFFTLVYNEHSTNYLAKSQVRSRLSQLKTLAFDLPPQLLLGGILFYNKGQCCLEALRYSH